LLAALGLLTRPGLTGGTLLVPPLVYRPAP
jgi:hypothetical protein